MRETKLYAKLRPHLMVWGECDRVENAVSSGMSDVFYNIGGKTGWIETKVTKGDLIYFEKFQPNWIAKHSRLGARMFVLVMDRRDTIHLYPAGVILKAPRVPYEKWITVNMNELPTVFNMEPPYRSWNSVRDILTS
ncbi:MAG TPA: hypothetical protein VF944_07830 [Candidatus Bathyarchaeia archaeon]